MSSGARLQTPQPFESFRTVYATLIRLGCYKLLHEPSNRWKLYFHYCYRFFYFSCIMFLNVQQLAYLVLACEDIDTILNTLATEIPQLNLMTKFLTLYLRTSRIDKLHEVMDGPYFSPKSGKDEEYINRNNVEMNRLMRFINIGVNVISVTWLLAHYLKRIQEEPVVVPLILPVDTNTWFGFSVSVFTIVGVSYFLGMGHIAMDCLVATYYAQATTQLKILKYNLEHVFDGEEKAVEDVPFMYKDEVDERLKERFVYYVQKYDTIVWFTKEVNSVFNFSMSFQFLTATACTCFVIYTLSNQQFSAQFIFLVALLFVFQTQVFLYCYYGSLVEYESQSVIQSAFLSDWVSLSPSFRRILVIAMIRWTEPLRTRVSVVIPLSVTTSITIVRSAYTLFTLMSQAAN